MLLLLGSLILTGNDDCWFDWGEPTTTDPSDVEILNGNVDDPCSYAGFYMTETVGYSLNGNGHGVRVWDDFEDQYQTNIYDYPVYLIMEINGCNPEDEENPGQFTGYMGMTADEWGYTSCLFDTFGDPPQVSDQECENDDVPGDLGSIWAKFRQKFAIEGAVSEDEYGNVSVTIVVEDQWNIIQGEVPSTQDRMILWFEDDKYAVGSLGEEYLWYTREFWYVEYPTEEHGDNFNDINDSSAFVWPLNSSDYYESAYHYINGE